MMSPLLNAMPASAVRSPCSRITSTPVSDSTIPPACASVSRIPEQHQRPHRDEQRPGRLQQQRVQRRGVFERPVLQGVEGGDAGNRKQDHDAEPGADRAPVAAEMFPGEGKDNEKRQRPAQERQRHRRNMPGGEPADDGVAGPAQRGDAEQQIGLVGEPVAGRGGAGRRSEADMSRRPVHGAAARPASAPGRKCDPARLTDTDFRRASMAQMHRDHARSGIRLTPRIGWKSPAALVYPAAMLRNIHSRFGDRRGLSGAADGGAAFRHRSVVDRSGGAAAGGFLALRQRQVAGRDADPGRPGRLGHLLGVARGRPSSSCAT